jgi:hypothetical protein
MALIAIVGMFTYCGHWPGVLRCRPSPLRLLTVHFWLLARRFRSLVNAIAVPGINNCAR